MKHLVLIDGHHMMYRAYWAIPRTMKTREGEQVNTVFGMASMILTVLQKEQPDYMVLCFDEGSDTVRHQEHEEYKAGRAETPDDFYVQIPRVMQFLDTLGLPVLSDPEYEADDLIGTYAVEAAKQGMRVTVVSGDKDLLQLASDSIRIAIPHKGYNAAEYLGPDEVYAKYGITPAQVASYKGLSGDSSDNLPGVHGIGPKTASSLLQEFGSLQGIYDSIASVKPSWREKLERDKEQAFFCERLATLHTDITLPRPMEDAAVENLPARSIEELFGELQFTLLSKRLASLLDSEYGMSHFDCSNYESVKKSEKTSNENQMALF